MNASRLHLRLPDQPFGAGAGRRLSWAHWLFPPLLAVLIYANSLGNEFTFDDYRTIVNNPCISGELPLSEALKRDVWCLEGGDSSYSWRPLTAQILRGFYAQFGLFAPAYHLASLALYALLVMLVLRLAWRLTGDPAAAFLCAALYAAHPVHAEAVASISSLSELLAALFLFISLNFYASLLDRPNFSAARPAAWIFLFGALLAKETALAGAGLFALIEMNVFFLRPRDDFPADGRRRSSARAAVWPWLAGFAALGGYLLIKHALFGRIAPPALPQDNPLAGQPWNIYYPTALSALGDYLRLTFWPARLSIDYSFNQNPLVNGFGHFQVLWPAAVLIVSLVAALAACTRRFAAAFGVLFPWITLAAASNLIVTLPALVAERLLLVPTFGPCLLAGYGLARLRAASATALQRRLLLTLVILVLALMAGRAIVRNLDWRSNLALFSAAREAAPESRRVRVNLGWWLRHDGRWREALAEYERAERIGAPRPDAFLPREIGLCRHALGNFETAADYYRRALAVNPKEGVAARLLEAAKERVIPERLNETPR